MKVKLEGKVKQEIKEIRKKGAEESKKSGKSTAMSGKRLRESKKVK